MTQTVAHALLSRSVKANVAQILKANIDVTKTSLCSLGPSTISPQIEEIYFKCFHESHLT
jgi:hypothetical protein